MPSLTTSSLTLLLLLLLLATGVSSIAPTSFERHTFNYETFTDENRISFIFKGGSSSIGGGALQLTPDTINAADTSIFYNKSGRIMYYTPFRLYTDNDQDQYASFNSTFLINIYTSKNWTTGDGLAFLIAPDTTIPENSYGRWLGLTNATIDGNPSNKIVAVEFDSKKDEDPDGNHVGLNINSIRSNKTASLSVYNITLSPRTANGTNYAVWVEYNGSTKVLDVYMVKEGPKPLKPILSEVIDLKKYVNEESYFGFSASTGYPEIELNCVLKWSLNISSPVKKKSHTGLKIGVGVGVPLVVIVLVLMIWYVRKRRLRRRIDEPDEFGKLKWLPGMPREFKFKELTKATNGFNEGLKLGEGGFGIVYKGVLCDDQIHEEGSGGGRSENVVAVKKFSRDSIKSKVDFLAELTIIHLLRHKNLVPLVGWCYEKGKLLLVYTFMPNGSLEKHLYEPNLEQQTLNWSRRYNILAGVASALYYLHNECKPKVIHRDIKSSNILLDAEFNGRLGDFGLARALEDERNSYAELELAGVPGTMGYVAPECFHTGRATPESDVYGFGAVVLEIVCARNPGHKIIQQDQQQRTDTYTLVDWVWMLHRQGRILEAVDVRLGNVFPGDQAERLLLLGLACSHPNESDRPKTQAIFQIITGTLPAPSVPYFKPVFTWPSSGPSASTSLSTITLFSQENVGATRGEIEMLQDSSDLSV